MTIKALFPTIRPTLNLDFANTRLLDPRVTFTRASTGTFVGSNGLIQTAATNVPRFDHNPTTGESLGLLVEEARTNLLLRSEEFSETWVPGSISIATDTTTAPSGANTADTLTVAAGAPNVNLYQTVACIASTAYTFSIYIRLGTLSASDFRFAVRDDSNGAFIASDVVPSVTLSTSTWQRIVYTFTTPVGCTLVRPYVYRFSPAAGGTFFAWGAQLEAGAFPTSYIPTTSSTVTRAADVASITGTNFSSWYNQTEGTMFAETQLQSIVARNAAIVDINDATSNNRNIIRAFTTGSADQITIRSGSTTVATLSSSSGPGLITRRTTGAYRVDDFSFTAQGLAPVIDTTGAVPASPTQMLIGSALSLSESLGGTIKRLTYWPVRLGNNVLQAITQ